MNICIDKDYLEEVTHWTIVNGQDIFDKIKFITTGEVCKRQEIIYLFSFPNFPISPEELIGIFLLNINRTTKDTSKELIRELSFNMCCLSLKLNEPIINFVIGKILTTFPNEGPEESSLSFTHNFTMETSFKEIKEIFKDNNNVSFGGLRSRSIEGMFCHPKIYIFNQKSFLNYVLLTEENISGFDMLILNSIKKPSKKISMTRYNLED